MRLIHGLSLKKWIQSYSLLEIMMAYEEVSWKNPRKAFGTEGLNELPIGFSDILDASNRLERFKPLIQSLFPETESAQGLIESELTEITHMKNELNRMSDSSIQRLFLKRDSDLPIAGSVKARGGIYEILKLAETLAFEHALLKEGDSYVLLASEEAKALFKTYAVVVGSTGNLGMSIGIMSAKLGFQVTVHMSADAKAWKKAWLRANGVTVVEHASDYSKAVAEGRHQAEQNPKAHFVDDENSMDLFLGYSVAALRLKVQLEEQNVTLSPQTPLIVHIPCGVGGAPGGIAFGLKHVFKECVKIYLVEPTHSPSMLLGLMTGKHDQLAVQDFGIDNYTEADGLACGRPSKLAGRMIEKIIDGVYTIDDQKLFKYMQMLYEKEGLFIEPSAAAGFFGTTKNELIPENSIQIVWATGGALVPQEERAKYLTSFQI